MTVESLLDEVEVKASGEIRAEYMRRLEARRVVRARQNRLERANTEARLVVFLAGHNLRRLPPV